MLKEEKMEVVDNIEVLGYFSPRKTKGKYRNVWEAIKAHLNYISRNEAGVYTYNMNKDIWKERVRAELSKRKDARIALKFVFALPRDTDEKKVEFWKEKILEFFKEEWDIPPENITLAFHLHLSKQLFYNPHVHVLVYPRRSDGKKLRTKISDLRKFRHNWRRLLENLGYKIKKPKTKKEFAEIKTYLLRASRYRNPPPNATEFVRVYRRAVEKSRYDEINNYLAKVKKNLKEGKLLTLKEQSSCSAPSPCAPTLLSLFFSQKRKSEVEIEGRVKNIERLVNELKSLKKNKSTGEEEREKVKESEKMLERSKEMIEKHFNAIGRQKDDMICVVATKKDEKTIQRFVTLETLLSDKFIKFLRYLNARGYNIYATVNKLKQNARTRKQKDFEEVQNLIYLDVDTKKKTQETLLKEIYSLVKGGKIPQPTHIIRSSKGNYQFFWRVEPTKFEVLRKVMKKLSDTLELDAVYDLPRVMRIPSFFNKKQGKNDFVINVNYLKAQDGIIESTYKTYSIDDFKYFLEENVESKIEEHKKHKKVDEKVAKNFVKTKRNADAELDNWIEKVSTLIEKKAPHLLKYFKTAVARYYNKSKSEIERSFLAQVLKNEKVVDRQLLIELIMESAHFRGKRDTIAKCQEYAVKEVDDVVRTLKDWNVINSNLKVETTRTTLADAVKNITKKSIIKKGHRRVK